MYLTQWCCSYGLVQMRFLSLVASIIPRNSHVFARPISLEAQSMYNETCVFLTTSKCYTRARKLYRRTIHRELIKHGATVYIYHLATGRYIDVGQGLYACLSVFSCDDGLTFSCVIFVRCYVILNRQEGGQGLARRTSRMCFRTLLYQSALLVPDY